ncbi:MAG: cation:proton antiporter [Clostridiaceae bacterium]
MLTSLSIIILLGLSLGKCFKLLKMPSLLGMLITGMILGPYALNLLDPSILAVSADLRQLALIVILTRAGLALDLKDLRKVGRPALLMCFVPATFEILGVILLGPPLLGLSLLDSAILGTVLGAVSPAVIVPRMLKLMGQGYGKEHSIPQLILAGASVDDVYVIVLFTAFTSLAKGGSVSAVQFLEIPVSILLGILAGIVIGLALIWFFKKYHMRDTVKILIIISLSALLLEFQNFLAGTIPFSGLLAIMSIGITIYQRYQILAERLSNKYNKIWVGAEILLFVLVGATVDLSYALAAGVMSLVIVAAGLLFRVMGVSFSLSGTKLSANERIFAMMAYTPKATVQAAIGGIPLAMGLASGNQILTVAVLSILLTAPLGALLIDHFYPKLLERA